MPASEQEQYAEIVAKVKAEFADKRHAGDEVGYEIAKRWAKHRGDKFTAPRPVSGTDVPATTNAPTAPGFPAPAEPAHNPRDGMRTRLPDPPRLGGKPKGLKAT